MDEQIYKNHNLQIVSNFQDLVTIPFHGEVNAMCWKRTLQGDFEEVVHQLRMDENILEVTAEALLALDLSVQGQLARQIILDDLALLKAHGALPSLNLIKYYERDEDNLVFPTDVYSYHVDSSPLGTDTFLCTYFGAPSEILPNVQAEQKILVPAIRQELEKLNNNGEAAFELFINENFYDLHYQAKASATPMSLGIGHLWRLATANPHSEVLPCIHRAPEEKEGQPRLLLIC